MGKKGKGKKGKGPQKPVGMSDEMWALSNNIPDLILNTQGKGGSGPLNVSRGQAAFFLWQLALSKGAKGWDEIIGGQGVQAAIQAAHYGDYMDKASSMGLVGKLLQEEAGRENLLSMRNPQPIPVLFNCLNTGTPHTVIAAITAMRTLTEAPETRKVFVRNVKDWTDIIDILKEEHGWQARSEAARCLGLCSQYGSGDKQSAQYVRLNTGRAGGIQHLVDMCSPDQDWGAAGAVARSQAAFCLLHRLSDEGNKQAFQAAGGVRALVVVMKDPLVTLEGKASAAGALYKYMSLTSGFGMDGEGSVLLHSSQSKLQSMSLAPTEKLPGEVTGNEAVMLKRVQAVADSGAIEYIVVLCSGPDGPPPKPGERPATASAGGKKKKGKKGKKGKQPPMPPGMPQAHIYASGCLRQLSYDDNNKAKIVKAEAPRFLAPLLESNIAEARWHARATLLNMAMDPQQHSDMHLCGVPQHILSISSPAIKNLQRPTTAPI